MFGSIEEQPIGLKRADFGVQLLGGIKRSPRRDDLMKPINLKYILGGALMTFMLAGCQQNPPSQPVVVNPPPNSTSEQTTTKTETKQTETKQAETPPSNANPDASTKTTEQTTTTTEQKKKQ